jgi:hypothetical protein
MNRALLCNVSVLGLGLLALTPTASAQGTQGDCLQQLDALEQEAAAIEDRPLPDLSHLAQAARDFAQRGEEERCLEVVADMREHLVAVVQLPEVERHGPAVRRPVPPVLEAHPVEVIDGEEETAEAEAEPEPDVERRAVSPVAPPPPTADRDHPQPPDTLASVPPEELPVDELTGRPLVNNWGAEIGYVEGFAVPADDPEAVYAVVSETGEPGFQGDEVLLSIDRLRVPHPTAVQWTVGEDETQDLADLPRFDPAQHEVLTGGQQATRAPGG